MVTVTLTRAEWDIILMVINEGAARGYFVDSLYAEIEHQVYSQEY